MNYYERHIGDYLKDTVHLSLLEHGIYGRLLDIYYTKEEPIPAATVMRLVGARSDEEISAVRDVLNEFFQRDGDVYRHSRCDREIERFRAKSAKARASAELSHVARRANAQPSDSERNANAMRTHSEGSALQTPDTSNHKDQPLPFPEVRECLRRFSAEAPKTDAAAFHAGVMDAMRREGWRFEPEARVDDRGDGRAGRIDILVTSPCVLGIELDRQAPRAKSVTKLGCVDGYRVVMLRESPVDWEFPGLDAVLGCADDCNVHEFPPGFDAFWEAYPRKTAKPAAAKAFARLKPDERLLATMLAAVRRQAASDQWTKDGGQFIPHPSTWLNGRRWEDSIEIASVDSVAAAQISETQAFLDKQRRDREAAMSPAAQEARRRAMEAIKGTA